jgi:hypothetical protein
MNDLNYYMLIYNVSDDYLERRGEFRREHLELATKYMNDGRLILGGAAVSPADSAYLCFKCESDNQVEDFVKADPYYTHGLIKSYEIRQWKVVTGSACDNPILPKDL